MTTEMPKARALIKGSRDYELVRMGDLATLRGIRA